MTATLGRRDRTRWIGQALAAPNSFYLLLVLIAPLGIVATYSVFTYSPTGIARPELTLSNYHKVADPYFIRLMVRTAAVALKTTFFCAMLAYPVAYYLARAKRSTAVIGLFLLLTPLMVTSVVRAFGWLVIFGRNGVINNALVRLGFTERLDILYSEFAVLVGLVHLLLPFMVLPLMASIERISPSVEEAARNLGAKDLQVFTKIIVRLSLPGLISGALLVYVEAASAFVIPALLGGRHVRMVGNEVYEAVLVSFNWPLAAALTVTLVALTLLLTGAGIWLARQAQTRA